MLLLPYELIDIILKMASTYTDLYYLQMDHKTGKLIYKHNMNCPKIRNMTILPIKQIFQHLCHNNKMYEVWSYLHKDYYYKKNKENTIFIYYKKIYTERNMRRNTGELIENGISYPISDYNIWSSIQHDDGWCYDLVGFPVFTFLQSEKSYCYC